MAARTLSLMSFGASASDKKVYLWITGCVVETCALKNHVSGFCCYVATIDVGLIALSQFAFKIGALSIIHALKRNVRLGVRREILRFVASAAVTVVGPIYVEDLCRCTHRYVRQGHNRKKAQIPSLHPLSFANPLFQS